MNRFHRHTHSTSRAGLRPVAGTGSAAGTHRRGGAALIVVISLLGTLAFLGFLFYSFAAQEVASAEYFSRSETPDVPLPPGVFWNWSLKQLIVGTDAGLTNSALYGNKHAIIPNMIGPPHSNPPGFKMFGTVSGSAPGAPDLTWGAGASPFDGDVQPFDGAGITAVMGTTNGTYLTGSSPMEFGFDINQDGVYDPATEPTWQNFIMNFSPAADSPLTGGPFSLNGTSFSGSTFYRDYEPDAGYTYPDINSLFLGYDTTVRGWRNTDDLGLARDYRVIIPSFFRPQLFPTRRGTNDEAASTAQGRPVGTNDVGFADLYLANETARQVLRPHVAHIASFDPLYRRFVPPPVAASPGELDGDADGDGTFDGIQAKSGDRNRVIRPFPFLVDLDDDGNVDRDGDGSPDNKYNEMGVWTSPLQGQVTPTNLVNYELDVDADGDGVRDSIWIDLDFPMMTLEDGRQFVPMFAFKVIDADALLNVNAHGNAHGLYVRLQDGSIKVLTDDGTSPPLPIVGSTLGTYGVDGLAEIISFHQSHLGLSPWEVNLSLALAADLRTPLSPPGAPDFNPADPRAAQPVSQKTVDDLIATQFELAWNYGYNPGPYPGGPNAGPRMPATGPAYELNTPVAAPERRSPSAFGLSNLEALQIINGRRVFDQLRDRRVRENRTQILGRHGDRFKIRELYRRLMFGDPDYPDGLSDGESIPGPQPGGYNLDDDGDSNQLGLAAFFGGPGDDDIDAPGIGTMPPNVQRGGGSFYYDENLYGVQIPPSVHPLDTMGIGSGIYNRDATGMTVPGGYLTRQLGHGGAFDPTMNPNPSVFPTYLDPAATALSIPPLNYWHYNGRPQDLGETDLTGVRPWRLGLNPPPAAMPTNYLQLNNDLHDFLIDEPNEVILEPELRNPEYDGVFPVHEMEGLHLTKGDANKIKAPSQLGDLATINLGRVKEEVRMQTARRLTTDSWDRLEPGQTRFRPLDASTPAFRFFEYNNWNGATTDFATAEETFPPEFDPVGGTAPAGSALDPIRPELRLLLKNERLYSGSVTGDLRYPRKRLNINRILSGEEAAPGPGAIDRRAFSDEGEPRFRQLTPHPNVTELNELYGPLTAANITIPPMVHDNEPLNNQPAGAPPFSNLDLSPQPGDPAPSAADIETLIEAQEWWARYDRQRLARDIYTLLYTLGGGLDGEDVTDPAADPYPLTATTDLDGNGINDNLEAMAQFAVNYVDGLDHDNVITRFEYDVDLSDGWQWTTGGAFVNGVEAQQLTFSEVVWTRTADSSGSNYGNTPWDDDDGHHQFLHIELRSVSPFDVELGNDAWRIVRTEPQVDPSAGVTQQARVTFQRDPNLVALTVGAGENFTIGASDKNAHPATATPELPADFYIRSDMSAPWECIVPAGTSTETDLSTVNPRTDLDLVADMLKPSDGSTTYTNYMDYYTLDAGTTANGQLVHLVGLTTPMTDDSMTTEFDLVLQRRRHLNNEGMLGLSNDTLSNNLDSPESSDWIEVDRIRVTANNFMPNDDADVPNEAEEVIVSQYRLEPLNAPQDPTMTTSTTPGTGGTHPNHTIADYWDTSGAPDNSYRHSNNVDSPSMLPDPTNPMSPAPATTPFTLWQPHPDRDYSSVYELLAVPLYGPEYLTRRLVYDESPVDATPPRLTGEYFDLAAVAPRPALAGRLFMNTDPFGDTDPIAGTGLEDDNRWYRVLEYLEVPNRAEEAIRERLTRIVRTPGKINLNTLRDEHALAALVDDLFLAKFTDPNGRMTTTDPDLEPLGGGSNVNPGLGNLPTYVETRNWMDELRLARDGIDPVNYFAATADDRTYIPLPGIPGMVGDPTDMATEYGPEGRPQLGAVPFRPLSYVNPLQALPIDTNGATWDSLIPPTAHTILRNHVGPVTRDMGAARISRTLDLEQLQLFEARPTDDIGVDAYDYHTRNRLLAKLANNSTERSNVFVCWIVVEFFEAHQPDPVSNPQIVQVGGKLEGSPTHRGFFVIDRSRIERAVDQDSITNSGNGNGRDDNFRFDWREFVIHRRTIQ
jgi:hypothetical protein